jgi:mono/diheme cytochrome c family protein
MACAAGGCRRNSPPPDGAALYAMACARCHGATGLGGVPTSFGPVPRNFHDGTFQKSHTDEDLRRVIVAGKSPAMPPFGMAFTKEQLDAIVRQIRRFGAGD